MAFRTDLAVEAIENHKTAAALPHVRQSDRTLEGFAVHEVRILSEDARPRDRQAAGALSHA